MQSKIRAFAEWEEQECLLLSLPHDNTDWRPYLDEILASYEELVSAVSKYQKCILICPDLNILKRFNKFKNCEFLQIPTDDTWIRDYGLIDVSYQNIKISDKAISEIVNMTENEASKNLSDVLSYDFKFNAWGGKFQSQNDNAVNSHLAKYFNTPLKSVDMVLEGGSIEFNGKGTLLTTTKCLLNQNRNANLNKKQIEAKLSELFGLNRIVWLENGFIRGDDTDSHIDTLARFISPNTVACATCDDKDDEHFVPLNAMRDELLAAGFNVVELPLPKPKYFNGSRLGCTYTNFIFINNALIVPTYDDLNDKVVLERLAKELPNHDIIGINSLVFVRQNGSLHCSSQNRFKRKT